MKVYLEEFAVKLDGGTVLYASIKEAVSDALLMSAPIDACIGTIRKRGYEIVDIDAYKQTDEYKHDKAIDLMICTMSTIHRTYH